MARGVAEVLARVKASDAGCAPFRRPAWHRRSAPGWRAGAELEERARRPARPRARPRAPPPELPALRPAPASGQSRPDGSGCAPIGECLATRGRRAVVTAGSCAWLRGLGLLPVVAG